MIKMCIKHWNMLKDEINKQGLRKFVSKTGEEVMDKLEGDQEDIENFDPLINANIRLCGMLISEVQRHGDDIAEGCPVCRSTNHGLKETDWIGDAVADQHDYAVEKGLITVQ